MLERTYSLLYIFSLPLSKRYEYQVKHILSRMIKPWFGSWLAPPRHQLIKFHHVTWTHQAAMILRMSTHLFCKGLNIKRADVVEGLSILEIYSDWMLACLIYTVWSTFFIRCIANCFNSWTGNQCLQNCIQLWMHQLGSH